MSGRKAERILIKKDVTINGILKALAFDISEGGMYICTQAEFIPGAMLDLSFDVDDVPIKVKARVRHTQPGVGIGVRFGGLSQEDSIRIKRLLQTFSRVFPVEVSGRKKVLLVDDDAQTRSIYKMRLFQDGFYVIEASNGLEAIRSMQDSMPDIIVLDLWMECMDGFKVLQLMQMNPDLKMIPVLVLSARSVPADVEKAIGLGAKEYLVKMTTTPKRLSQKVKEVLGG